MVAEIVVDHGEQDFGWVRKVVARLVKEDVTKACSEEDACDDPSEQIVKLVLGDPHFFFLVDFPHGDVGGHERKNVHDAVPAHREVPKLECGSIKISRY